MKKFNLLVLAVCCILFTSAQTVANFENLNLSPATYWNGSDMSGGFNTGNAYFVNSYDTAWGGSWSGFGYSNVTDNTTPGFMNQYSAVTGSGYSSANYGIGNGYGDMKIKLEGNAAGGTYVKGFYVTNATYAYLSMQTGDQFAKKFGGATGTDPDFFKLTVNAWLNGAVKQQSVEFMLADFTSADSTLDYIVDTWEWVNLQPLGNVDSLSFSLTSSDNGQFGMNTPAYFAIDNFTTADIANTAPIVIDDAVTINYNTETTINVLGNDFDTTATPLTITTTGSGLILGSSVSVDSNSNLVYTPEQGIVAVDTVMYSVCDDAGLCTNGKVIINITSPTGINDATAKTVKVFPNPFSNLLTMQGTEAFTEVAMYDLNGRLIDVAAIINGNNATINTSALAAGIYVVKAVTAKGAAYSKVSK